MQVVERIVSGGHGGLSPSHACIHETANPGATALDHVSLWSRDDTYAVHYVGDWTGVAYHCVPDDRLCWQVGNGNSHVVGIELCHATNAADFEKVWNLGVEWAAMMLERRGWGVERLISHDDARRMWGGTDHTDPIGYFAEFGRTWEEFKAAVAAKLEGNGPRGRKKRKMECLIKPNGENYMVYFDGSEAHPLTHPDEMKAIQEVYRICNGEDIPCFEYGSKSAPWATRLFEGASRKMK